MEDKELLSTDDLLEELVNRFDSVIFYGLRKDYKGINDDYLKRFVGEKATLIGLCHMALDEIVRDDTDI